MERRQQEKQISPISHVDGIICCGWEVDREEAKGLTGSCLGDLGKT